MKSFFVWAALLMVGLGLVGCQDVTKEPPEPPWHGPYSPRIVMLAPSDTLRYLPGDLASAPGYVQVRGGPTGNGRPGIVVTMSVTRPDVGYLQIPNDTTDADGHVNFTFYTHPNIGDGFNTIHAQVGDRQDNYALVLREIIPGFLTITASPDTINPNRFRPPVRPVLGFSACHGFACGHG